LKSLLPEPKRKGMTAVPSLAQLLPALTAGIATITPNLTTGDGRVLKPSLALLVKSFSQILVGPVI
jgi:hypothetical protein